MSAGAEPWWKTAVVYQIYPRSFADSDGDGIGDLPGIAGRLDHLGALGIDVLWLSPVYPSPQDDAGYDISDYQDVDPTFGTLADLDALVAAVHERGIRLILDLVVNHTSDEHPWFAQSRASRESPKRDWYWWRGPREGMRAGDPGAEPTNWGSAFGGSAWELDPATGEYYLHLFSRKQPDLNWESPAVREAVYAMMRWWLERGVDGFRMDVINLISKDLALPDYPVSPARAPFAEPGWLSCGPRIHEFLQEMHREVIAGREDRLLTVGEMPGVTIDEAKLFTDPARRELDMVFQFEHVDIDHGAGKWDIHPLRLTDLKASFGRWQAGLAERGWNSLYWNNHDQPRVVSRFGDDGGWRVRSAKMLGTVLHLHRGTPYVYQGEELGMTNAPFRSIEDFRDIESLNHHAEAVRNGARPQDVLAALRASSRDNARTPMQWDASEHAGFTTGTPWLAVNPNHAEVNVEAALADPDSVLHHYRRLIELRHTEPAVAHGDFEMLRPDDPQVYAFARRFEGVALLVLGNFSGEDAAVPEAAEWAGDELLLGNCRPPEGAAGHAVLRPWEARVYRRGRRRSGVVGIGPLPDPQRGAPIVLADPDPAWPERFAREAQRIRGALGERARRVEHVGSTSVPGMPAKPIIDIVLAVPDPAAEADYVPALEALGYALHLREPDWHEHRLLKPADRGVNLHVFAAGASEIERMVAFRDHLRTSPEAFDLYLATKRALATRTWACTQDYADAKDAVVAEILGEG